MSSRTKELANYRGSHRKKIGKVEKPPVDFANNIPKTEHCDRQDHNENSTVQPSRIEEFPNVLVQNQNSNPKQELVGKVIKVKWPSSNLTYVGLVVGCQTTSKTTKHKVYYAEDETVEILDLSQREWGYCLDDQDQWFHGGLVSRRILVYCSGKYDDEGMQKLSEERFGKSSAKVAYEAFVVKYLDSHKYRILYTSHDDIEERRLTGDDSDWILLDAGVTDVDGLAIISWSYHS